MWNRHIYNLSGAVFFGDDVLLEIYSDRPRPKLITLLKKKGITVSGGHTWFPKELNGDVKFYIIYHVEKCRYCPHGERKLFTMDTHRTIDEINAGIL